MELIIYQIKSLLLHESDVPAGRFLLQPQQGSSDRLASIVTFFSSSIILYLRTWYMGCRRILASSLAGRNDRRISQEILGVASHACPGGLLAGPGL